MWGGGNIIYACFLVVIHNKSNYSTPSEGRFFLYIYITCDIHKTYLFLKKKNVSKHSSLQRLK